MPGQFELQGHRGARGRRPENTLPSFELALDCGVTSIETDLHLSRDGVPIISHDPWITEKLCSVGADKGGPHPSVQPLISTLDLEQLRGYRADHNPDPKRFPTQEATTSPLATQFAEQRGFDPYGLPTLAELFAFVDAYATELGHRAGKSEEQRGRARRVWFDLELKRVPFHPNRIGDLWDGSTAGWFERQVVECVRKADRFDRTRVRSFDHRCVCRLGELESKLECAVLVAGTAPIAPETLAMAAGAKLYCPEFEFLDHETVTRLQRTGLRVLPWTVNRPADWRKLIDWGIDGITTDYPVELAEMLKVLGIDH